MSHPPKTRLSTVSLGIGLAFLVAASAAAAQATTAASAPGMKAGAATALAAGDKTFVQKAAVGGIAEVEMGKMAQQKASNDQVKQFGSRMVEDHSRANDELKKIASSKGIALPTELDAKHKAKMDKMQKLSGAQFDRAYMDDMVADHKEDVSEFQKQAKSGSDADIKGFASKTLPTLQEHLTLAESTDKAVKGGK